jgi:hypothetical protein
MATNVKSSPARLYTALGTGAVLVGALAYIGLADPHRPTFLFPACPLNALTGLLCPGCGGLRMTHDVLHGDLAAAVTDNVFALVGIPMLLAWILVRKKRDQPWMTPIVGTVIIVAAVAWTVVRNLPGFPLVPTVVGG